MNIYKQLNLVFDYIEEHLFDDISVGNLSQFIGTSTNNFKNFFSLLHGASIYEYIRNRRLSECVKLLENNKIIDVAILCGYESRAAFSRAFKAFHGFNPSEYNKVKSFNYVSRLNYSEDENRTASYQANYKIINEMTVYGISKDCKGFSDISEFWCEVLKKYPIFKSFDKNYGLVYKNKANGKLRYCIGLEKRFANDNNDNEVIYIQSGKYLSIVFGKEDFDKISALGKSIKSKNIDKYPNIEIYSDNSVELLFKVFD